MIVKNWIFFFNFYNCIYIIKTSWLNFMKEIFNESRRMSFTYYKLFLKHISSLFKEYILLEFIINLMTIWNLTLTISNYLLTSISHENFIRVQTNPQKFLIPIKARDTITNRAQKIPPIPLCAHKKSIFKLFK